MSHIAHFYRLFLYLEPYVFEGTNCLYSRIAATGSLLGDRATGMVFFSETSAPVFMQ
jgi:hypothetical protein